jgi:hypothetical protein
MTEEQLTVVCRGRKKVVVIYRNSVEKTRDAIRRRCSIEGEFRLQARQPGSGDLIDIEDEDDVDELQQAAELIVPGNISAGTGDRQLVPSGGQVVSAVDINTKHLEVCSTYF